MSLRYDALYDEAFGPPNLVRRRHPQTEWMDEREAATGYLWDAWANLQEAKLQDRLAQMREVESWREGVRSAIHDRPPKIEESDTERLASRAERLVHLVEWRQKLADAAVRDQQLQRHLDSEIHYLRRVLRVELGEPPVEDWRDAVDAALFQHEPRREAAARHARESNMRAIRISIEDLSGRIERCLRSPQWWRYEELEAQRQWFLNELRQLEEEDPVDVSREIA